MNIAQLKRLTYEQAQRRRLQGRMSLRDWHRFRRMWKWSSPRFNSRVQDAYCDKYGYPRYMHRVNRMRRAIGFKPLT